MAEALKCDRCGVLYEKYIDSEINTLRLYRKSFDGNYTPIKTYDLCKRCNGALINWLAMEE